MWLPTTKSIRPHPFGMHPPSVLGHASSLESGARPTHVRKSMPTIMADCLWLLAAICLGMDCLFFFSGHSIQRSSEVHPDICSCKMCWCMGHWRRGVHGHRELASKCAWARGTGAQVCTCRGHWPPVVHAQVAPASKCACAVGTVESLMRRTQNPNP